MLEHPTKLDRDRMCCSAKACGDRGSSRDVVAIASKRRTPARERCYVVGTDMMVVEMGAFMCLRASDR